MDEITILIFWLALWVLTMVLAVKRGRSVLGWAFLALLISPLLTCIILLCIGETQKRRFERIAAEEHYRSQIARRYSAPLPPAEQPRQSDKYKHMQAANHLGKTINDLYKK